MDGNFEMAFKIPKGDGRKICPIWRCGIQPYHANLAHEWTRNLTLGELDINKDNQDQLALLNRSEIPRNVTDFSSIQISFFDDAMFQFFGKIRRLLSNLNLSIGGNYDKNSLGPIKAVLRHVLPLINGIDGLCFYYGCSGLLAFFQAEFPSQLDGASILKVAWPNPGEVQVCLRWLFQPKMDAQPKKLFLSGDSLEIVQQKIRQTFMDPLIPSMSYFVRVYANLDNDEASTIQNDKGEQLVVRKNQAEHLLLITRCSADVGEEWLAAKFQQLADYRFAEQKQCIEIDDPEIGPIDEAAPSGSGSN